MPSPDYISPICREDLEIANELGEMDAQSRQLLAEENYYIKAWRKQRGDDCAKGEDVTDLVGLALSGGGIRSATFSLGIMQALASHNLLHKIDYLSSVSGGGYIGAAMSWLTSSMASEKGKYDFGTKKHNFPFGSDDPRSGKARHDSVQQKKMLHYLQQRGYYLTPGAGLNAFTLMGAILRGTILNLMVWLPTFVFLYWSIIQLSRILVNQQFVENWYYFLPQLLEILSPEKIKGASSNAFDLMILRLPELFVFEMSLILSVLMLIIYLVIPIFYSFSTWYCHDKTSSRRKKAYQRRHKLEQIISLSIPPVIFMLIFGTLPIVAAYLDVWVKMTGPVAILTGIVMALRDFVLSAQKKKTSNLKLIFAAAMLLYGISLVSFQSAFVLSENMLAYDVQHFTLVMCLLVFPLLMGFFVNLNYISIHRFYRDRLMETFMPDIEQAQQNKTAKAEGVNKVLLHEFNQLEPRSPYHIINTNFIAVNAQESHLKHRGGDNFILTPLYCGSNVTGWRHTNHFMNGKMTLSTAVAISGAAANPNTGVGGIGLTRNLFISLVMSLLNLRLGYWVNHPRIAQGKKVSWLRRKFLQTPNHFRPGAYAYFSALGADSLGYNENRSYLQLSDGGHFENMGLYELIRRRVKVAIVCDGGADPEFSFADMQRTLNRIEHDFGAKISILDHASADQIIPAVDKKMSYPPNTGFAQQGHMVGRIIYADDSMGWLVFLKTTLIENVSFQVKGYKAQNSSFPDQSTANQFFDETQFEAYRELGYCITEQMLASNANGELGDDNLAELIARCGRDIKS